MNKIRCRRCGSTRIVKAGIRMVAGKDIQQYRCKRCGLISYKMRGVKADKGTPEELLTDGDDKCQIDKTE